VRESLPPDLDLRELGTHRLKDLSRPEEIFQLVGEGLDSDFPPLRSLDNPGMPNNLPEFVSSFIGRDADVAEVRDTVRSSRLVTLAGPGGVGKTRLALQVAADLVDGSGDGVWFVELANVTDPDAVAMEVARTLRIREQAGGQMYETLVDALADQYVLVVLDNCEHLIGTSAKLAESLMRGCPRVHLLATSREPLGIDGETIFRVPSLSLPIEESDGVLATGTSEAVKLFVDRARTHTADFELTDESAPLVAAICCRLEGVPYAIELAAARLRSMSLQHLHDRLDQVFRVLSGGSRTALPRQQSLKTMIDWSYQLLNPFERVLLLRLSVFLGGFELEAAEAVCGFGDLKDFQIADLLGSLVDKSLVQTDLTGTAIRYRLLETIRQYAAEAFATSSPSEVDVA
jgi:predicted ATPase